MSVGNWLRTYRKQIIAHTSIIVVFVLLTIFVINPAFERLERVPGEAQLQRLPLPAETGNIRLTIDVINVDPDTILCWGWAFIEGYDIDLDRSKTYIVLQSDRHTYIFDTATEARPDVYAHFAKLGLDLLWAGFNTNIPVRKIAGGEYNIDIYINRGDMEGLEYTTLAI